MKSKLIIVAIFATTANLSAQRYDDQENINAKQVQQKIENAERLINDAVAYFGAHTVEESCRAFQHDPSWQNGELVVSVIRCSGAIWTNPYPPNTFWMPMTKSATTNELKHLCMIKHTHEDDEATSDDEYLTEKLELEGKWFRVKWYNRIRSQFVRRVIKDKVPYLLITSFFAVSKHYDTMFVVEQAVSYFDHNGLQKTIELINQRKAFRLGESAVFMMDMEGNYLAETNPVYSYLVGKNLIQESKEVTHEFSTSLGVWAKATIDVAKTDVGKGWVPPQALTIHNAQAHSYVERVEDPVTKKQYILGASWWDIPKRHEKVQDLATRATTLIKNSGIDDAKMILEKNPQDFMIGWMGIDVVNQDGKILYSNTNPEIVGQYIFDLVDDAGQPFVFHEKHKGEKNFGLDDGTQWVDYIINKANFTRFIKKLVTPEGTYFVTSGYYPSSKELMTENFVRSARRKLENSSLTKSLHDFKDLNGLFFIGDLEIFVYSMEGNCFVHGNNSKMIWQNYKSLEDQNGKPILQTLITIANRDGAGWATFAIRNALRKVYITKVEKTVHIVDEVSGVRTEKKKTYIVGSGYYV